MKKAGHLTCFFECLYIPQNTGLFKGTRDDFIYIGYHTIGNRKSFCFVHRVEDAFFPCIDLLFQKRLFSLIWLLFIKYTPFYSFLSIRCAFSYFSFKRSNWFLDKPWYAVRRVKSKLWAMSASFTLVTTGHGFLL